MGIFDAGIHRLLDFVTVIGFALAPTLFALTGPAAYLAYALAAIHLVLTLLTHFPGGVERPVPLVLHGGIELVVGIALLALPSLVGWAGNPALFYRVVGGVILVVWAATRYRGGASA